MSRLESGGAEFVGHAQVDGRAQAIFHWLTPGRGRGAPPQRTRFTLDRAGCEERRRNLQRQGITADVTMRALETWPR